MYAAQLTPRIDAEIVEKRYFWMETTSPSPPRPPCRSAVPHSALE